MRKRASVSKIPTPKRGAGVLCALHCYGLPRKSALKITLRAMSDPKTYVDTPAFICEHHECDACGSAIRVGNIVWINGAGLPVHTACDPPTAANAMARCLCHARLSTSCTVRAVRPVDGGSKLICHSLVCRCCATPFCENDSVVVEGRGDALAVAHERCARPCVVCERPTARSHAATMHQCADCALVCRFCGAEINRRNGCHPLDDGTVACAQCPQLLPLAVYECTEDDCMHGNHVFKWLSISARGTGVTKQILTCTHRKCAACAQPLRDVGVIDPASHVVSCVGCTARHA